MYIHLILILIRLFGQIAPRHRQNLIIYFPKQQLPHKLRLIVMAIATFEEYILIAQIEQKIEIFRRDNSGWRSQIYGMGKKFTLESIGLKMAVTDLYRGTSLESTI